MGLQLAYSFKFMWLDLPVSDIVNNTSGNILIYSHVYDNIITVASRAIGDGVPYLGGRVK